MRRLGELVGLSKSAVDRAVDVLEANNMLRVAKKEKGRGQIYVARERMSVRIGSRVICTIVMDYVPSKLRSQLEALEKELESPGKHPEAFANVEIIPGEGFVWDEGKNAPRPFKGLRATTANQREWSRPLQPNRRSTTKKSDQK